MIQVNTRSHQIEDIIDWKLQVCTSILFTTKRVSLPILITKCHQSSILPNSEILKCVSWNKPQHVHLIYGQYVLLKIPFSNVDCSK